MLGREDARDEVYFMSSVARRTEYLEVMGVLIKPNRPVTWLSVYSVPPSLRLIRLETEALPVSLFLIVLWVSPTMLSLRDVSTLFM
jgi:hypothetical protein